MSKEQWKSVVGYEGLYEISNQGRIKSLDRIDALGRNRKGVILKPIDNGKGYLYVNLHDHNGKTKKQYVHRLCAFAFLGECPENNEVDHIDGNHSNNTLKNLRYLHCDTNRAQGAQRKCKKVYQYSKNGEFIAEHPSRIAACRAIGVKDISSALSGKCKTAGGYVWKNTQQWLKGKE